MPAPIRVVLLATALAGVSAPVRASAQGSPYIRLDDPRLPLLEHLIARGDVEDPSPMVRPFRRSDAARVLAAADTSESAPNRNLLRKLLRAYRDPTGNRWMVDGRAGIQAYTHPRRELLHPAGADGIRPYFELAGTATLGNLVLVTRPTVEPRLVDDPDWLGRRELTVAGRVADAYVSGQFRYAELFYGQMDRNWGPVGLPGIPLSNYGYERQGLAFQVGTETIRLSSLATDLQDQIDSVGQTVHRYYFVHRLQARLSRRLTVAPWEGIIVAGPDRTFETRYRNPLSLGYLANTIGFGDRSNVLLGVDVHWRAFGRTTLQAQLALDDFWYDDRERNRDRWALTLNAAGPFGRSFGWQVFYTQVSSLALRAFNPADNFTDGGVGVGRNFSDQDQLTVRATVPVRSTWLLSPELTLLRQGEGRINDPYPVPDPNGVLSTPALFIGVVERTYRAAVGLSGRQGPLDLAANAGFHRVVNSEHQEGRTVNRFEGRLQVTLGLGRQGELR
ncbi:MAG TPA: hypothetical protein VD930_01930 [Gemmatimonadales bacterium]|nr:hypothetical protein [Gemmatimonadales bacterium]